MFLFEGFDFEGFALFTGAVIAALTIISLIQKVLWPPLKFFINRKILKRKTAEKKEENDKEISEKVKELEKRTARGEEMDEKYIEDSARLDDVQTNVHSHSTTLSALQKGVLSIIRDRLLFLIRKHLDAGYIGITDLEILQEMFSAYEQNEGNHIITTLMEDIYKLPKKE